MILYIILSISFLNCGHDSDQQGVQSYIVWVDNLRLRAEPDLKSPVLNHLPVGTVVEWSEMKSNNRVQIELRGEIFDEPFFFVTDHQGTKGWLYAGAIYKIANAQLTEKEKEDIKGFLQLLNNDLYAGIDTGRKALNYYADHFGSENLVTRTGAAVILIKYLQSLEIELWDILESFEWPNDEDIGTHLNKDIPIFNRLRNSGFKIGASEGMFYPEVDWKSIGEEVGIEIDEALIEYLKIKALDQELMTESDGAIIVPIEELGTRAIRWENFNTRYPFFVMDDLSKREEERYKYLVLNGIDNTPAIDWQDQVNDSFRKGWKKIVDLYPESPFAILIKRYIAVLENNGWTNSPEAELILSEVF